MDVPPVKAATTAEETIQSWSTVGESHQPQILLCSLSVVKMSTYLDVYSYIQRLKSATFITMNVKKMKLVNFFHIT